MTHKPITRGQNRRNGKEYHLAYPLLMLFFLWVGLFGSNVLMLGLLLVKIVYEAKEKTTFIQASSVETEVN
jgi:hypothetical protein